MSSTQGEKVEAVLEEPLFSADHKLVLPEGTLVNGAVVTAEESPVVSSRRASPVYFPKCRFGAAGRGTYGRVRRRCATVAGCVAIAGEAVQFRTRGTLSAAESGNAPVKVDKEGGVQATESKKRFIGTAVAAMIARRAGG